MTSHGDVCSDERKEPTARRDDDQRATAADKKEAVTDGVIRQLIDQIAQLQRASDARRSRHDIAYRRLRSK